MPGPFDDEWYLRERVSLQSMKTISFYLPKPPPLTMLHFNNLSIVINEWKFHGKVVIEFVENINCIIYKAYKKQSYASANVI